MSAFVCARCQQRGKTWSGGDPVCGFDEAGAFVPRNWNCATLNALRELTRSPHEAAERGIGAHLWHEDENIAVLPMPDHDDGRAGGFMLLRWYKNRGRTDSVLVWEKEIRPATLSEVETLLERGEYR